VIYFQDVIVIAVVKDVVPKSDVAHTIIASSVKMDDQSVRAARAMGNVKAFKCYTATPPAISVARDYFVVVAKLALIRNFCLNCDSLRKRSSDSDAPCIGAWPN
jgi:hypothetical protein